MPRNALFAQRTVGGIFALLDESKSTGNFWFVNATGGVDAVGNGTSPDAPFKTINFASTQCVASNGDTIVVMPGHTETIAAAGGITLAVAGVRVVGLGKGRLRPQILFSTANTSTFLVTANNCSIENLYFNGTGFAAIATLISVTTGTDFTINNCEFELGNSTNQAATGITTAATANRLTVTNCNFHNDTTAGTASAMSIVGGDSHFIANNFFQGPYTTSVGAISNITTAMTNARIQFNYINNVTTSSTKAITCVAGSTGMISDNCMQILSGAAPITGAAMSWVGCNYYAATIATAGTLI